METYAQEDRCEALVDELAAVWEASVRPTHLFLSEEDIVALRPQVREALLGIEALAVAFDGAGCPEGFVGVEGDMVEMLFVSPESFGKGVGKSLLTYAVECLGARKLDVNEGNPNARGFYEHAGFAVVGRSALDGQGRPFPLLHMELRDRKQA